MDVHVCWTAALVDVDAVSDQTVIVIDVLRATTMMARLLDAGAAAVYPVTGVDEAKSLAKRLGPGAMLAGERGGLPLPGFDLGNSPLQVDAAVAGKAIVMTTTNGTRAIGVCRGARRLAAAAFVNAEAAVAWALKTAGERLYLVCAGTRDAFSMDDALCAGLLASRLAQRGAALAGDEALAASWLYEKAKSDLPGALRQTAHGQALERLGMGDDIAFAANVDAMQGVPARVSGGRGAACMALDGDEP